MLHRELELEVKAESAREGPANRDFQCRWTTEEEKDLDQSGQEASRLGAGGRRSRGEISDISGAAGVKNGFSSRVTGLRGRRDQGLRIRQHLLSFERHSRCSLKIFPEISVEGRSRGLPFRSWRVGRLFLRRGDAV